MAEADPMLDVTVERRAAFVQIRARAKKIRWNIYSSFWISFKLGYYFNF
jgi:hypothetical protein